MSDKAKKIVLNVSFTTLVLLTVAAPFICWNCIIDAVRATTDPEPILAVAPIFGVAMLVLGPKRREARRMAFDKMPFVFESAIAL